MKSMRIPLICALCVAIIGIVFGSFFDRNISEAIASASNPFALTVAAVAPTIGFGAITLFGGAFLAFSRREDYPKWGRILFLIGAIGVYGGSIALVGGEYFGPNGFEPHSLKWVGYLICPVPLAGFMALGYFLFKDCKTPYVWVFILIAFAVAFVAYVPGCTVLKSIFHRPRYRVVVAYQDVTFHAWWQRCTEYLKWMDQYGLASEEFKSYPSGHSCEAAFGIIAAVFGAMVNEKMHKYRLPIFLGACAFALFVAFSRILAAAHYLSDVSTGITLTVLFTLIGNEVVIHVKKLKTLEESEPVAE